MLTSSPRLARSAARRSRPCCFGVAAREVCAPTRGRAPTPFCTPDVAALPQAFSALLLAHRAVHVRGTQNAKVRTLLIHGRD